MGQAGQSAATWQQRARGDPAEALRQRYAELHGTEPVLHANPGQAAKWGRRRRTPRPTTRDQRALEIGLHVEMMRREAELRAAQQAAPPQGAVAPLQLPMGGGMQVEPAAGADAAQPDSNSNAGVGITGGSPRTREESPPRAEEVVGDVAWNQRPLRVLDDREVLQYARLTTISLDEVIGGTVIQEWPEETWLGVLRGVC